LDIAGRRCPRIDERLRMTFNNDIHPQRPLLRGVSQVLAAIVATTLGAPLLLLIADSPRAHVGAAIFGASLILLYATSAAYHRIQWTPLFRAIISRLDHSMVLVLIGGTYTPFCLLVLGNAWGITMLSVVWGIAGVGILLNTAWPGTPRWLRVGFYVALGWVALVAATELAARLAAAPMALLVLGGALYTVGGVIYAVGKPDPWPRVFGHLEVFHLFIIAGSVLHYLTVAIYVLPS
jgi:hemolysin III